MEEAISLNVTPIQALLALAFQAWLIIFPILILQKLNRMNRLLEAHFSPNEDEA